MKALNLMVVMAALAFADCDKDKDGTPVPTPVPPPVRIALHLQYKQQFTAPFFMQGSGASMGESEDWRRLPIL